MDRDTRDFILFQVFVAIPAGTVGGTIVGVLIYFALTGHWPWG